MHYDIATKVILSHCKEAILSLFCGLPVKDVSLLDIRPQETPSLRRADFVFRAVLEDGKVFLILVEIVSYWKDVYPLRLLETRCRHKLQENLPVITVFLLLKPAKVGEIYRDEEVEYRYRVVRIYEIEVKEILESGPECLLAFVPLMKGGERLVEEAERKIYGSGMSRKVKADLLTGMAILGGLVSEEIPRKMLERRRDIMIESAGYELIKREGYEEGLKVGIQQGIQKGLEQGIQQGLIIDAQEMLVELLEERFGIVKRSLVEKIKSIESREILKALFRVGLRVNCLEEFEKKLEEAML